MTPRELGVLGAAVWSRTAAAQTDGAAVVHVCATADDALRIAATSWELERTGAFDQVVLDVASERAGTAELEIAAEMLPVDPSAGLLTAFEQALERSHCVAVLVYADDDAALAAALAAARLGVSLIRVGAPLGESGAARAISRLADLQLVPSAADAHALRPRVAAERIYVVGEPAVDVARRFGPRATRRAAWHDHRAEPGDYVLVCGPVAGEREFPADVLVEPPAAGHLEHLSLLQSARAVLTRSVRVGYEAAALGVPCFRDPAEFAGGGGEVQRIALWDGRAGARIARVLVANFARVRLA